MPTETNEQPTNAETPAEEQVYFPGVEAPPKKQAPIDEIPAENQVYPFGAGAEPTFSASVQPFEPQVAEPAPQPAVNMTYVYAAVAVALGVLAAILVAAFLWTGIQKTQQSDWPGSSPARTGCVDTW